MLQCSRGTFTAFGDVWAAVPVSLSTHQRLNIS